MCIHVQMNMFKLLHCALYIFLHESSHHSHCWKYFNMMVNSPILLLFFDSRKVSMASSRQVYTHNHNGVSCQSVRHLQYCNIATRRKMGRDKKAAEAHISLVFFAIYLINKCTTCSASGSLTHRDDVTMTVWPELVKHEKQNAFPNCPIPPPSSGLQSCTVYTYMSRFTGFLWWGGGGPPSDKILKRIKIQTGSWPP